MEGDGVTVTLDYLTGVTRLPGPTHPFRYKKGEQHREVGDISGRTGRICENAIRCYLSDFEGIPPPPTAIAHVLDGLLQTVQDKVPQGKQYSREAFLNVVEEGDSLGTILHALDRYAVEDDDPFGILGFLGVPLSSGYATASNTYIGGEKAFWRKYFIECSFILLKLLQGAHGEFATLLQDLGIGSGKVAIPNNRLSTVVQFDSILVPRDETLESCFANGCPWETVEVKTIQRDQDIASKERIGRVRREDLRAVKEQLVRMILWGASNGQEIQLPSLAHFIYLRGSQPSRWFSEPIDGHFIWEWLEDIEAGTLQHVLEEHQLAGFTTIHAFLKEELFNRSGSSHREIPEIDPAILANATQPALFSP